MNPLYNITLSLVIAIFALAIGSSYSRAQPQTDLCLKSGVTIHASRIAPQKGGYLVTPKGEGSPSFSIPASEVREIGAACEGAPAQQGAPVSAAPQADPGSPRFGVHGSELLGARLMPLLVEGYAKKRGWSAVAKPTGPNSQEIELTAPGASQPSAVIDLTLADSTAGFAALTDGRAAIAMSTRRASVDEAAQVKARFGVELLTAASGAEHVVALDALAVIVNRDNPIKRLRLDQMAQIFSGQVTNWKDVRGWDADGEEASGTDGPIHLHALDARSDSFGFFKASVLDPFKAELAAGAQRHDASKKLSRAVGKDVNAIGFVEFPYVSKNDALHIRATCGLSSGASRYNVKTEQYPLTRRLHLYTIGEPQQRIVKDFVQFFLSDEAQGFVRDAGFVDQAIEYQDIAEQRRWFSPIRANPLIGVSTSPGDGSTYSEANNNKSHVSMAGAEQAIEMISEYIDDKRRTSLVFRFESNSYELDSRARQDLIRLSQYLKTKYVTEHSGADFELVGFADSSGNSKHNYKLSQLRANRVYDLLRQQGVTLFMENIGRESTNKEARKHFMALAVPKGAAAFAPVACNDSEEGRAHNRRVETWLKDRDAK